MDLIFMVIDADFGFLVLLGGRNEKELVPVVVKEQENLDHETRELRASEALIRKVIQDNVALLSSKAMANSRWDGAKSLYLQKIKSAMCVLSGAKRKSSNRPH